MAPRRRRAAVVGGSLGGLTAALLLHEAGFTVSVHERSFQLADRGAGIIAHPESLRYLLDRRLADIDEVSIPGGNLRYIDSDGQLLWDQPSGYRYTSWFALYARLLQHLPSHSMHFDQALEGFDQDGGGVTVHLRGGGELRCDLLVGADGIASTARRLIVGGGPPAYAGYLGWRGTVPTSQLPPSHREALGAHITYQLLEDGHMLAYPIPDSRGPNSGDGASQNWIWYRRLAVGADLTAAMTDISGQHHDLSVPPGAIATAALTELHRTATSLLADDLAVLVQATAQPFIQRVVDIEVPSMAQGRVCLIGDAAFVGRPHAAAGTAKAAADGWSLAAALAATDDIAEGLRRWQPGQLALGRSLVRRSRSWARRSSTGSGFPAIPACALACARLATPALMAM